MSWSTSELRVRLAPLNRFKPSSKIFYWPFQGGTSFVDLSCFCSVLCLLCLCARLLICALWSPAGKGMTSWLSFVVSNCEFVTFPLVSWVRCGTWLYRFWSLHPFLLSLYCSIRVRYWNWHIWDKWKQKACWKTIHFNPKPHIYHMHPKQKGFLQKKVQCRAPGTNYINISHESKAKRSSETVIWQCMCLVGWWCWSKNYLFSL